MVYENILYEQNDKVLKITLNRPDKLNALNEMMLHELADAFACAEKDTTARVVVLAGAGRGFCSGADLAARLSSEIDYGQIVRTAYNPLVLLMRRLPKPIIAAVNGVAAGAGMSLALACDLRITAESASFTEAFVKIGLVPDSGSTWMLPRLIGLGRALDLMLTGRRVSASEALSLGIVNQVVPDDLLADVVTRLADEFAAAPTRAVGYIKQAVEYALEHSLVDALEKEAELQHLAGKTADHMEGVRAFIQKRQPEFKGE